MHSGKIDIRHLFWYSEFFYVTALFSTVAHKCNIQIYLETHKYI